MMKAAADSGQLHRDNAPSGSYFGETSNHPGDSMTSGFSQN